ncbi:MAG: hypothetical protein H0W72_03855 [Planctomycetes bacterium]|nr:hypothetical protein [Planctomycetota bacterium]
MSTWQIFACWWLGIGLSGAAIFTIYRAWECRANRMPWDWSAYLGRVVLLLLFWPLAGLAFLAVVPSWLRNRRNRR